MLDRAGGCAAPFRHFRFLTIHRFGHPSGCGERFGGLSAANIYVSPARVLGDMPQEALIHNIIEFLCHNLHRGRGYDGTQSK